MRIIALDGAGWATLEDLYDDLLPALGAPDWHGRVFAALIDSIGTGDINAIEPPYLLRISGAEHMNSDVLEFLRDLREALAERIQAYAAEGWSPREVQIVLDGDF